VRRAALALVIVAAALASARACADTYFLTVAGLGGEPDYERRFGELAANLDRIWKGTGAASHVYTLSGAGATRAEIVRTLEEIAAQAHPDDDFVLVLIGHGSDDGVQYKLNLPGPDLSARALAALCDRIQTARQLIVNTTSASGGSVAALAHRGRAVIAATKSGTEKNATVFARFFVDALEDPTADVDKNQAVTALEAFEYASAKTAAFFASQKRLATEHAVFEDRGRGPAVRAVSESSEEGRLLASLVLTRFGTGSVLAADPAKRALLAQKQQLEQRIDELKYRRAAMPAEDYKRALTEALVALAKVEQELDR